MTSEEYCNYGCQVNSSGSDYCKSGNSATSRQYSQCGSNSGACVWPVIASSHLVTITQNAGNGNGGPATNGNWLCVDDGVSNTCVPTSTPTPTETPTPTPHYTYSCYAGGAGEGGGACNSWWDVDPSSNNTPGALGGLTTDMTMANIYGGNGTIDTFMYLIDHTGQHPICQTGGGTPWIRVGLENPGYGYQGEYFEDDICPSGGTAQYYNHTKLDPIPVTDYGFSAGFSILQTDGTGMNWVASWTDNGKISNYQTFTEPYNPFSPNGWRMGIDLGGQPGGGTNGTTTNGIPIDFTNNKYCFWNSSGQCTNFYYYGGTNTYIDDDQVFAGNFPLQGRWITVPSQSTTGGDYEAFINYNQPPTLTPTPTITPTPTPVHWCTSSGGTCVNMTYNNCIANCNPNHSNACLQLDCASGQSCCYNFPTPTPTPTPVTCASQGGTCIKASTCTNNCTSSNQYECADLNCGVGQLCCI